MRVWLQLANSPRFGLRRISFDGGGVVANAVACYTQRVKTGG